MNTLSILFAFMTTIAVGEQTDSNYCIELITSNRAIESKRTTVSEMLRSILRNDRAKIDHILYRIKTYDEFPKSFSGEFLPSLDDLVKLVEWDPSVDSIFLFTTTVNDPGINSFYAAINSEGNWMIISIEKEDSSNRKGIQPVAGGDATR